MEWVSELRESFRRVRDGQTAVRVSFAARPDVVGEIGSQFNSLAESLERHGPNGFTRQQVHSLRNCLAGILAALHMLEESEASEGERTVQLKEVVEEARALDAELMARRS